MADDVTFTPGEWRVDPKLEAIVVGDEDYPPMILIGAFSQGRGPRIANLRLAAAAPNLLAAIREVLACGVDLPNWLRAGAEKAIAKATGK